MKVDTAAIYEKAQVVTETKKRETETAAAKERETFTIEKGGQGKVSGSATYDKPKADGESVIEDIAEQASVQDATTRKNEMLFGVNTTSEKDAAELEEDGFSLNDTPAETIVTETDKIKLQLAKAGVDISSMGDGLSKEQLEELAGNTAWQLEQLFKEADLPATDANQTEAQEALTMVRELTELSDGAIKYMLDNGLTPTIENLFKAEYSGSSSYTAAAGVDSYDELIPQMQEIMRQAGIPVTEESLSDGMWLVANDVPLTRDNLLSLQQLRDMQLPVSEETAMQAVVQAVADGRRPKEAVPAAGESLAQQAQEAAAVIEEADEEALAWLVANEKELTVDNLREAAVSSRTQPADTGAFDAAKELALLTAKRQLEEARLAMTAQANYSLLKQGISIDTRPLAELVDTLRAQEDAYYQKLLTQAGTEANEQNTAVFRQTIETVEGLKETPAYTLGIPKADEATLEELYEAGRDLQRRLKDAGESYETMMTRPRSDMGDSMKKAFANVDDILKDLGLEANEANERAVRILAYNKLEINADSVMQIKAADEEVARAFKNLTPNVVREMIAEGKNPLDMTMPELNETAAGIRQEMGDTEERFSRYLWKLEQNQEITEQERDAFIGIYRLIAQVEKTDGAAIGALYAQGGDITMRNLLTQVRSAKHGQREYEVDDSFGGVEAAGTHRSITEQIEQGYQTNCIRDVLDALSPQKLMELMQEDDWQQMTPEQLAQALQEKEGETESEDAYRREQLARFEQASQAPEQVYQMLADYDLPNTANYVLAAWQLVSSRNDVFTKLFAKDGQSGLKEAKEALLQKFEDAMQTPEELAEAQKQLADTAENVMKTMLDGDEEVTSLDLREMKLLHTQISIMGRQAKEEQYSIPVLIGDEVTNVSLKIVRGKERKGMADILFSTEKYGKVAAQLKASNGRISGYAVSDRKETTALMAENAEAVHQALKEAVGMDADISYLTSEKLDLSSFGKGDVSEGTEQGEAEQAVQTATLYRMSESFLKSIKAFT